MHPTTPRWSFLIPIVLFTLACSLVIWSAHWYTGYRMGQAAWGIISYFMLLSLALHAWQEHALISDPKGFVRRYLAGLTIKMMLSLLVLVVILMNLQGDPTIPVAFTFIFLYLAYLVFSTVRMSKLLRRIPRA